MTTETGATTVSPINRCFVVLLLAAALPAADPAFLRGNLAAAQQVNCDITAPGAVYKPLFENLKAVVRYGELTVAPGASTPVVAYPNEEQLYFVTEGAALILHDADRVQVRKSDFLYLAPGVKHGVANISELPVKIIIMGYRTPAGSAGEKRAQVPLANADDVALQILGQHGPTTQFKLLVGLTTSTRDKLAAATVMNSLFLMDFAPGGTNIPHSHAREEEIYLLLRGSGEMVAGRDANGKDARHPVTAGDAFYFAPGTQVGYYSHAKEGQPHDLILAVRSNLPR
jgi:mannose-6-phosphate isomerase-like protein (cupin superfamily)